MRGGAERDDAVEEVLRRRHVFLARDVLRATGSRERGDDGAVAGRRAGVLRRLARSFG